MKRAKLRAAILGLQRRHTMSPPAGWDRDMQELYSYTNGALDLADAIRAAFCPDVDREDVVTWVRVAIYDRTGVRPER